MPANQDQVWKMSRKPFSGFIFPVLVSKKCFAFWTFLSVCIYTLHIIYNQYILYVVYINSQGKSV